MEVVAIDAGAGESPLRTVSTAVTVSADIDVREQDIGAVFGFGRGVAVHTLADAVLAVIKACHWHPVPCQPYRTYLPSRSLLRVGKDVDLMTVETEAVLE